MNFERDMPRDEPEINLIPFIDVLLVILIFLMVTTSFTKFSALQIALPTAEAEKVAEQANEIVVSVTRQGGYLIDRAPVSAHDAASLAEALKRVAGNRSDPTIIIHADAQTTHQSVINVLEAARLAQYARITFSTQSSAAKAP